MPVDYKMQPYQITNVMHKSISISVDKLQCSHSHLPKNIFCALIHNGKVFTLKTIAIFYT
jgi:hypothetical protein